MAGRADTPTDPSPLDMVESIITLRPKEHWPKRKLEYKEKHAGWEIFRYLYWGIYVFVIGCMLVIAGYTMPNLIVFTGWAVILLAVFLVVYGFVTSLHHRLMRRHG